MTTLIDNICFPFQFDRNISGVSSGGPPVREDSGIRRLISPTRDSVAPQSIRAGDVKEKYYSHLVDTDLGDRTDRSGYSSTMDYPIRGTMSPLTNQIVVKRSIGPVDEVSFVFGRPASPRSERAATRCLSPISDKRSFATSSDILPLKNSHSHGERYPQPSVGVGGGGNMGGILCENCNSCLIDLKRQALRLVFPDNEAKGPALKVSPITLFFMTNLSF